MGRSTWVRSHRPADCSASTPAYVVPGAIRIPSDHAASGASCDCTHPSSRTTSAPLVHPARGEPLGGQPSPVHAVRGRGCSPAHRRTDHRRRSARLPSAHRPGGGPATRPATRRARWSAERPSPHRPSRYTWAPHGLLPADLPAPGRPGRADSPHEYPPPAHRSPQPPPGRPLRRHGQVAVALRLWSARVLLPEWLARSADGSARPPEPGAGGVRRTARGQQRVSGSYVVARVAARPATRRPARRTTRGTCPPSWPGTAPCCAPGGGRHLGPPRSAGPALLPTHGR